MCMRRLLVGMTPGSSILAALAALALWGCGDNAPAETNGNGGAGDLDGGGCEGGACEPEATCDGGPCAAKPGPEGTGTEGQEGAVNTGEGTEGLPGSEADAGPAGEGPEGTPAEGAEGTPPEGPEGTPAEGPEGTPAEGIEGLPAPDAGVEPPDAGAGPPPDAGFTPPDAGVEPDPPFEVPDDVNCAMSPPEGALAPPPLPTYAGECPVFENNYAEPVWNPTGSYEQNGLWEAQPAGARNKILSAGNNREFLLIYPPDWDKQTPLPVIWAWHWLNTSPERMARDAEIMYAVKTYQFIAVVPANMENDKGDRLYPATTWAFPPAVAIGKPKDPGGKTGTESDLAFFDDVMGCLNAQFALNRQCISTMGVSAGALWSAYMATQRGELLSTVLSLSGGYSDTFPNWQKQPHRYHTLVLWGGCTDRCILDMTKMSMRYVGYLTADKHFTVECVHPCEHGVPPVPRLHGDQAEPKFQLMWRYALSHPYWVPPNRSPYRNGLPEYFPQGGTSIGTCGPNPSQCSGNTQADYTQAQPLCKIATQAETDCNGTFP